MLKLVSYEEMLSLIKKDHPFWVEEAQKDEAARYISEFDERLDLPLRQYLDTGEEPMFRYEEYSLYRIQNVKKKVNRPLSGRFRFVCGGRRGAHAWAGSGAPGREGSAGTPVRR